MIDELAIVCVLLAAIALVSCLSVEDKQRIRLMPRAAWMLAIIFLPLAGPAIWFIAGRPHTLTTGRSSRRRQQGNNEPSRPLAPDDNAEFLRSLDQPPPDHDPRPPNPPTS